MQRRENVWRAAQVALMAAVMLAWYAELMASGVPFGNCGACVLTWPEWFCALMYGC
jgi:hypothetical protein